MGSLPRTAGALGLLWWIAAGAASASPAAPPARPAPPPGRVTAPVGGPRRPAAAGTAEVILMAARTQQAAGRELQRAVGAQLSDAPVTLSVHWVARLGQDLRAELLQARRLARRPRVSVVFWCDLAGSDDVYLYLAEPGGGRLLVRRVPQGTESARAESVAIIVGTSVRAFLQAGPREGARARPAAPGPDARPGEPPRRAGPAAVPAEARASGSRAVPAARAPGATGPVELPPDVAVARRSRPKGPPRLSLELGYAVDSFNRDNAPIHGARVALAFRVARRWSLFLSYRVLQSIRGRAAVAEVELQRNPLALGGLFCWQLGRFSVGGAAALVVDYVATEARAPATSGIALDREPGRGDWHLLAAAGFLGGFQVVDRVWIELAIGAEFVLISKEYIVRVPSAGTYRNLTILRPWVAQPYAVLGVRLELF